MRFGRRWMMLVFIGLMFFRAAHVFGDAPSSADAVKTPAVSGSNLPGVSPAPMAGQNDAMTDIIDIKPIEKIGYDTRIIRYILYAILAVILLILLIYLLDRFFMRKKKKETETAVVLPPDQVAMNSLIELETLTDLGEKEFYFRLTAIVRAYVKGRFSLDAPEMTTEELLPKIPSIPIDKTLSSGLKDLLKTTDPVKFAGFSAGQAKMVENMDFAKRFVEMTRIVPEDKEKEKVA